MDRSRADEAVDEARSALAEQLDANPQTVRVDIAADPDGAEVIPGSQNEWCPAATPCVGRPAVRVAVPVRIVKGPADKIGEKVGDVEMIYCPACRTGRAVQRETL